MTAEHLGSLQVVKTNLIDLFVTCHHWQIKAGLTHNPIYYSVSDMADASAVEKLNNEDTENGGEGAEGRVSLKRTVGIPGGVAFLVGTMIGSGIFATPKWVLIYTGSVGLSLVVWSLCGLVALLSSLCYIELGTLIPKSGGEYAYLMEALGPLPGFLVSWVFVLFIKPAGAIMILLVFAAYAIEPIFPGCGSREDLVPLVKLLAVAALGECQNYTSENDENPWNLLYISRLKFLTNSRAKNMR